MMPPLSPSPYCTCSLLVTGEFINGTHLFKDATPLILFDVRNFCHRKYTSSHFSNGLFTIVVSNSRKSLNLSIFFVFVWNESYQQPSSLFDSKIVCLIVDKHATFKCVTIICFSVVVNCLHFPIFTANYNSHCCRNQIKVA